MTLRKLLYVVAGILGPFLPWISVSAFFVSVQSNAFGMNDFLPILLAILSLICGAAMVCLNVMKESQIKKLTKNKIKKLDKMPLYIGIAMTIIAAIAFIYMQTEGKGMANVSIGVWIIGIAGICAIILSCLKDNKSLDKVVFGEVPAKATQTTKAEKSEKSEKSSPKKTEKSAK